MNNSPEKFKATFKMTTSQANFRIDIPLDVTDQSSFLVTTVLGRAKIADLPVFIHCADLSQQGIYESSTLQSDLISSCVLGTVTTKPITGFVSTLDIGYKVPTYFNTNANITLRLTDINGNLINNANLDFISIGIEFFNRGG
jgi:hypothetical protein